MPDPRRRVIIAGIGNIFLGDDGFGVEVARRLADLDLPDHVTVGDYGISGMHLAYDLADGAGGAILIDAVPRGEAPGTVYVIEAAGLERAKEEEQSARPGLADAHDMRPDVALGLARRLGGHDCRVVIVGSEPGSTEPGIGLTEPVAAAVDSAVTKVLELIGTIVVPEARETDVVPEARETDTVPEARETDTVPEG